MTATSSPALRPAPRPGPPAPRPVPAARRVAGRYRVDRHTGGWTWTPEMTLLLGLPRGCRRPCTDLLVRALDPADRPRVLDALTAACAQGLPFSLQVRLSGRRGGERHAVLVGEPVVDASGSAAALEGLLVEVPSPAGGRPAPPHEATPAAPSGTDDGDLVHALETEIAQLHTAMDSRAAIEQAKGILMLLTSCNEQVAFDLLAHIASNAHRKVRDVAVAIAQSAAGQQQLPDDVRALVHDVCPPVPHRS